jgi:hypothetical protein
MTAYTDLMRHQALIKPDAADALLDNIRDTSMRQWPDDVGMARAYECGQLRGTVRNLIAHIEGLHQYLRCAAVYGACNAWIDEHEHRLLANYGIDIRAEHAALDADDEADDEDEDEADVIAGLNAEYVVDQMSGMRRAG